MHASMAMIQRRILIPALVFALLACRLSAQSSPARALDGLLQRYAYRAFVRPRTGVFYDAHPPSNLTGVELSVVRLRSGSLRKRGVKSYREFDIPVGCVVQPYVRRVALVYHNLANWSEAFYPLPGFTYLAPVIGLLVYNASDLTAAAGLQELGVAVSMSPITINFAGLRRQAPAAGLAPKCVWFDLDGAPEFHDPEPGNVCTTFRQGHFSIAVNSTGLAPAPTAGGKRKSRAWKVVVGVVGGFVALVLLALLVMCLRRYRQERRVAEMEQRAEVGEALRVTRIGDTKAPLAMGTRTKPIIENEYVA